MGTSSSHELKTRRVSRNEKKMAEATHNKENSRLRKYREEKKKEDKVDWLIIFGYLAV